MTGALCVPPPKKSGSKHFCNHPYNKTNSIKEKGGWRCPQISVSAHAQVIMKYCTEMNTPWEDLGIYVEFAEGTEDVYRYKLHNIQPYRFSLTIYLPPASRSKWYLGIAKVLLKVEAGLSMPIRLNYSNASKYLSEEALCMIEYYVHNASFYMYGKPEQLAFAEDAYRRWRNCALRAQRNAEKTVGKEALNYA